MKYSHCIIALALLCGTLLAVPGVVRADVAVPAANERVLEDDFAPGLAIFALLAFVICVALAIIVAVIALAVLGLATILVALGVLSTSVLVGFIERRPSTGLRVFFIQLGAVAGIPCGIVLSCLTVWFFHFGVSLKWQIVGGAVYGLLGGIGVAVIFNSAWGQVVRWVVARYGRQSGVLKSH